MPEASDAPALALAQSSVLPPSEVRNRIHAQYETVITTITSHSLFPHPTLYQMWDFAKRTQYILSELDNIEAGRPVAMAAQIPDYRNNESRPDPEKAKEHMMDVYTRSLTLDMMVKKPSQVLPSMGMQRVAFGNPLKRALKGLMDEFENVEFGE
ncbi:hypothetical protein OQA88_9233 [Cercophora sp. LCS_1]